MFGLRGKKPAAPIPSPFDELEGGIWEPGIVQFAHTRTFQILLMPGSGHAGGGVPFHVDVGVIPFALRTPNTRIMARRENGQIVAVRSPGPKAAAWFRRYVDIPAMTREQVLGHLIDSTRHVVIRLRSGATREGWITGIDGAELVFDDAPSPFYAQATGTGEMAPPPERMRAEEIAAWMDEDGTWHEMPAARGF